MNRTTSLVVGIVALVLLGGVLTWVILTRQAQQPVKDTKTTGQTAPSPQSAEHNETDSEVHDTEVSVQIKDFAFSPKSIKVTKGTKVTWTNQDTVGHNVVAADATKTGGLPTEAPLLAKGQTYSFTFEQTGTFQYKCSPHPQMTATVEVVE